jgi:hypothetical protein
VYIHIALAMHVSLSHRTQYKLAEPRQARMCSCLKAPEHYCACAHKRSSHILEQLCKLGLVDFAVAVAVGLFDELLNVGVRSKARAQIARINETIVCMSHTWSHTP